MGEVRRLLLKFIPDDGLNQVMERLSILDPHVEERVACCTPPIPFGALVLEALLVEFSIQSSLERDVSPFTHVLRFLKKTRRVAGTTSSEYGDSQCSNMFFFSCSFQS